MVFSNFFQSSAQRRETDAAKLRAVVLKALQNTELAVKLYSLSAGAPATAGGSFVRMNLHVTPNGAYDVWARGPDGMVVGQATADATMLSASSIATLGATAVLYVAMHQIASELRAISGQLERIAEAQNDAANARFQQSLAYCVEAHDRGAADKLRSGGELELRKSLGEQSMALIRGIERLPDVREGRLVRVGLLSDRSSEIERSLLALESRLQCLFTGFSTLATIKAYTDGRAAVQGCFASFPLAPLSQAFEAAAARGSRVEAKAERGTIDLAGPWRHAHRALDVASSRLRLDDVQFGRQSTLVTIPLSEIRETYKNLGRAANAR